MVFGTPVRYLDEEARRAYMLSIRDGRLIDAKGQPFDTSKGASLFSDGDGRAIFVMDEQGRIFASNSHSRGQFHHSSFLSGRPVASAGELVVRDGRILEITRRSGHYTPTEAQLNQFVERVRSSGVDLSGTIIAGGFR